MVRNHYTIRNLQGITCFPLLSGVSLLVLNLSLWPGSSWVQLVPGPLYTTQSQVLSMTLNSSLWAHWLILSFMSSLALKEDSSPSSSHFPWQTSGCSSLAGLWLAPQDHVGKDHTEYIIPFETWGMRAMNGTQSLRSGWGEWEMAQNSNTNKICLCFPQNSQLNPVNSNRESISQKPKHIKSWFSLS